MAAGRMRVPSACCARRSSSRNGSERISMTTSFRSSGLGLPPGECPDVLLVRQLEAPLYFAGKATVAPSGGCRPSTPPDGGSISDAEVDVDRLVDEVGLPG